MDVHANHKECFRGRKVRVVSDQGYDYLDCFDSKGVVIIAPMTAQHEIILIEQFRVPSQKRVIEFPAGCIGDDQGHEEESFEDAAKRELLEESGYHANQLKKLTSGPASPGSMTEIATLYLAYPVEKVHDGGGVGDEDIEVHRVSIKQIHPWISEKEKQGRLIDPRIYSAFYFIQRELKICI